jgi:monofunctional biosynthetic peptidoglycan transglycosylase
VGQAADIALVTQKDSEDDDGDGRAPMAAGTVPEHPLVPETKSGSVARDADAGEPPEAAHASAERRVDALPPEGDDAEDVTPADADKPEAASSAGEAAVERVEAADVLSEPVRDADVSTSDERDDLQSRTLESVVRPYRQEDAVFVSLPVRHADVFQASEARLPPADDEAGTNYDLENVSASVPDEAEELSLSPVTDAHQVEDTSLSQAVMAPEGAADIPGTREPDGKPWIQPDANSGNDTSAAYARGSWDKPPPLTQTPPWVWRDVEPDIVPPRGEVAENPGEPVADEPSQSEAQARSSEFAETRQSTPEQAHGISATHEVQSANTAAQASEELLPYTVPLREKVAARVAEPPADAETLQSPAPQPSLHEISLPGRSAEAAPGPNVFPEKSRPGEAAASASLAVPAPIVTPYYGGRAGYNARVEPEWERPAAPRVFQHSRPGDFAPDRFEVPPASDRPRYKDLGRTALRYTGYAVGGYFALVFLLILLYRVVNPPASSLMLVQALTGTEVQQQWVSLDEISPSLVRAVIVSEDWTFCEHYGIDIKAIEQAIEKSGNGIPRGASTISMQTTKNLFLWNARSYVRKVVELPLTLMIELIWPKSRILEIYLNVAEWGPGIFGAEAAAQYHFNKPAARLDSREAAQLAASLPNPIIREAGDPGPRTARKASVIQSRMRNAGGAAECVLGGRR